MGSDSIFELEKPLAKLQEKIEELKRLSIQGNVDLTDEIRSLEEKALKVKKEIFNNLSPWDKVQLSRHLKRPTTLDYIHHLMTDFMELHGDRLFADDPAIVGGFARFEGNPIMILGHQKGRDTKENLHRNFGMASPEGFRKAMRLMKLAEKYRLPVFTLIDTPGAYPGVGAEERGQFVAISECLQLMAGLRVPILVTVIGEGGSGGAIALGIGDVILILEHSVYSVISPEGCASILWRDGRKAPDAAAFLHCSAQELQKLEIVDAVIPEPLGGAHQDPAAHYQNVKTALAFHFEAVKNKNAEELLRTRYRKFRKMGTILEKAPVHP